MSWPGPAASVPAETRQMAEVSAWSDPARGGIIAWQDRFRQQVRLHGHDIAAEGASNGL